MPDRVNPAARRRGAAGPDVAVARSGLDALPEELFTEVVEAVWWESSRIREAIHLLRRVDARDCDLVLIAANRVLRGGGRHAGEWGALKGRLVVGGDCLCREYVLDQLAEADRFLTGRPLTELRNPPGAVRAHVRKRAAEWTRRRRADMGAQTRTDRIRDGAIAARLPDVFHRALLEYIVDEAGSLAPLAGDESLRQRLAERAAAEFGGSTADYAHRVGTGLELVEAACKAGRRVRMYSGSEQWVTWWDRYVVAPLGRRPRLDEESLDIDMGDRGGSVRQLHYAADAAEDFSDLDELALAIVLRAASRTSEQEITDALCGAVDELVGQRLLSVPEKHRFVSDERRLRDALRQVRTLVAA